MDFDDEFELNIFNGRTTYSDDYRKYKGLYRITPDYSRQRFEKPAPEMQSVKPIDLETFTPLRKKIPLDITIVPNEITRGNPHKPFGFTVLPEDTMKEHVKKTRPRVYCAPQVSMDDIPDEKMRELLVKYMYTTDFRKAEAELISMVGMENRNVPNTVIEHDSFLEQTRKHYFSVFFKPKPLLIPEMTYELNRKGGKWTNEQLVATNNANELFWKNKDVKCGACFNPLMNIVEKETKDKIKKLIDQDWLRLPHDKKVAGYSGFNPEIAIGMGLEKKDLPCSHPLLSTSQVIAKRKIQDSDVLK